MLTLTIREVADVRAVHLALRQAAIDGVPAATVQLEAAELEGLQLQVGASMSLPPLDITLEGPTVLRRSQVSIRGGRVAVSGLTFVGNPRTGDALQVTAETAVALTDLAFVGQTARPTPRTPRRGAKAGGRPLAVWARGPETTVQVRGLVVADSTVPHAVSFQGRPHGRFGEISLEQAVFANVPPPALHVSDAIGLSLEHVWADGAPPAVGTASPAVVVLGDVLAHAPPPDSPASRALDRARQSAAAPASEDSP